MDQNNQKWTKTIINGRESRLVFFFRENLRVQYKLSTNVVLDCILSALCCPCVPTPPHETLYKKIVKLKPF